jgi:hypothetical protein
MFWKTKIYHSRHSVVKDGRGLKCRSLNVRIEGVSAWFPLVIRR